MVLITLCCYPSVVVRMLVIARKLFPILHQTVTTLWVGHPLSVSQLSLPSLRVWQMSINPCS